MKALIIYDSFFGNTEKVARAIGSALSDQMDVEVVKVSQATAAKLGGVDLLIVGSPTRAFSPSPEIKKFLAGIPGRGLVGYYAAAFDTRIAVEDANSWVFALFAKIFGYAAKPIANTLLGKGAHLTAAPEGFYVEGSEGPLKSGELERAKAWARKMLLENP